MVAYYNSGSEFSFLQLCNVIVRQKVIVIYLIIYCHCYNLCHLIDNYSKMLYIISTLCIEYKNTILLHNSEIMLF